MTRFSTRIVAGVGALALIGTMSACSRPSTAATVGTERITVAEVTEITDNLPAELRAQPGTPWQSWALSLRMRGLAAEQIAAKHGITNIRQQAEARVAAEELPAEVTQNEHLMSLFVAEAEEKVLSQHIGTAETQAAFATVPVKVNPRYGLTGLEPFETLRNPSLSKRAGQPE
ncbi:MAG: hypothetical protein Q4G46_02705 [Propionibacteriaceae bacterium]|nr:hypothetical protein [Propionibacteriaceae bacterium]